MATLDVLSLAEAKAAINVTGVTTYDTELPAWITAVSELLDSCVGPIVQRTITNEIHDGGGLAIYTRFYPVTSWSSVTEYASLVAQTLTAETLIAQPEYAYLAEPYDSDPTLYSGRLLRHSSGGATYFATGTGNVVVTYVAGRYANTAAVGEKFKTAARLILSNLWNSQRPNLAQVGEYEIPMSNFPRFSIPNAVKEMLAGEWQAAMVSG